MNATENELQKHKHNDNKTAELTITILQITKKPHYV